MVYATIISQHARGATALLQSTCFYDEQNLAYIAESTTQYANGQVVVKSLEELEAMENA